MPEISARFVSRHERTEDSGVAPGSSASRAGAGHLDEPTGQVMGTPGTQTLLTDGTSTIQGTNRLTAPLDCATVKLPHFAVGTPATSCGSLDRSVASSESRPRIQASKDLGCFTLVALRRWTL